MTSTPSDQYERYEFIENTLEHALEEFQSPELAQLGQWGELFCRALSEAVVLNLQNGQLELPGDYDHDASPLPVFALRPGEVLGLGNGLREQTPRQRQMTSQAIGTWKPRNAKTASIYKSLIEQRASGHDHVSISSQSAAMTGTAAKFIRGESLPKAFSKPPLTGLVMIKYRPVLYLRMSDSEALAREDIIAHELVHVRQAEKRPVLTYTSQYSIDMDMLRTELEAYHVGAAVAMKIYDEMTEEEREDRKNSSMLTQIITEHTRLTHNHDPRDPYKPSEFLQMKLNQVGMSNILHAAMSYDEIRGLLDNQAHEEDEFDEYIKALLG